MIGQLQGQTIDRIKSIRKDMNNWFGYEVSNRPSRRSKMKTQIFLFAFILLFSLNTAFAEMSNIEGLKTQAQLRQYEELKKMQWATDLTMSEKEIITDSLRSENDRVVIEALKVIAIHRLINQLPELDEGVGKSYGYGRILSRIIAEAMRSDPENIEEKLKNKIDNELLPKANDIVPLKEHIKSILVLKKCRDLRMGKNRNIVFSLNDISLSNYHKLLIKYSEMSRSDSIGEIIRKICSVNIAGDEEYNLVNILNTYGQESLHVVVEKLCDMDALKIMTPYGRLLLINALKNGISGIQEKDRIKFLKLLSMEGIKEEYFHSPISLKIQVELIEKELRVGTDQ